MGSKLLAKDLGNQSEGIVLVDSGSRKIVNICDFGSKKQEQIERWLEEEISRKYGERDSIILKNPLIRIITRFEALDTKSKYELYRYAKARIFESGQDLSLNGESLTLSQWAERTGIPRSTLLNRIKRGWDIEKVLTEPVANTGRK